MSSEPQKPEQSKDDTAKNAEPAVEDDVAAPVERFAPEEEAACKQLPAHIQQLNHRLRSKHAELLNESNEKKTQANALFSSAKYENAINVYEEAASVCPHYLDYELAVLHWSNGKKPSPARPRPLDGLARLDKAVAEEQAEAEKEETKAQNDEDGVEEEIRLSRRGGSGKRTEKGGWANLSGAEEDYKLLNAMENLSPADRKIVKAQLVILPGKSKAAQEKEMAEMWGKLKDLGNGILKPFGLSTENFKMDKDEKSGGYSMNFKQS
ncbi:hypothetical protein PG984_009997 [Apiospora sp. TS-2023a]